MTTGRFEHPSSALSLAQLLRQGRRGVLVGLALAGVVHLSSTRIVFRTQQQRPAKPLTTQFVKRAPRLTKPLELKKRPRPKKRVTRREMVAVRARATLGPLARTSGVAPVLGSLARPRIAMARAAAFEGSAFEPHAIAQGIQSARETEHVVDMSLEMMDIDALDTGKYHAMVIQDPSDKRNIRGFFHLLIVYSTTMRETDYHNLDARTTYAMVRLTQHVEKYTNIKADVIGRATMDSELLFKTPWIFAKAVTSFKCTDSEASNLGRYLTSGGFMMGEGILSSLLYLDHSSNVAIRGMFIDALATQRLTYETDWNFEKLPNTHGIYHCFFDFEGPPVSGEAPYHTGAHVPYLLGIALGGRLVGIVSNKGYANSWGDWGRIVWNDSVYLNHDPTRQLQFGVNLVIFALTQEGSITRQVMDVVR